MDQSIANYNSVEQNFQFVMNCVLSLFFFDYEQWEGNYKKLFLQRLVSLISLIMKKMQT